MTQSFFRTVFMRGGTSKGLFFHAKDLPADRAAQDAIFLAALGSPDPYGRQLDGMGGGISSLSKAVIIGPPTHPDADVDYTFAQVSVDRPEVDWSGNCGNLSSAVGPFAVDEGLIQVPDGEALVRIHQVNTRKIMQARFQVRGGRAVVEGDFAVPGVSGTGSRIRVDILDPGGSATGRLLPTGTVADDLVVDGRRFRASMVDAANPAVFLAAEDLGLAATESPDAIEADPARMALLDAIRRAAGVAMGLGATPEAVGLANPRVAVVAGPAAYRALDGREWGAETHDLAIRMISMERAHRAVPLTGGFCAAVAAHVPRTILHPLARPGRPAGELRLATPSGVLTLGADVQNRDGAWHAVSAGVFRTARRLMQGEVAVPTGNSGK
jgi:2-methylaconitate cis-trans-isomerase PrpF